MASIQDIRNSQRANGPATILAIGTANPPNVVLQTEYPDFYFSITNSEHMTDLKLKFKRICERSTIKKRYMLLSEEILKENPHMCQYNASSLDIRQDILTTEVPKLGKEAAVRAIEEWGQPRSKITHVIFCTTSGVNLPGADYQLTKLLELPPSVNRFMLYHLGCHAGGTAVRLAKDIAENNRGSRVLVVCSEISSIICFRGPTEAHVDTLVGQGLLGDGAGALIVGADPDESIERPIFQLVWAGQTVLPDSEGAITEQLRQVGLAAYVRKDVPELISNNIETALIRACGQVGGVDDWNSIFWILHPGGPAILDRVEAKLGLKRDKLSISRYVMSEFGNMCSASVLFVLNEMRKKSLKEAEATTGEGLEWGVLFGFGPGITLETVLLRSCSYK